MVNVYIRNNQVDPSRTPSEKGLYIPIEEYIYGTRKLNGKTQEAHEEASKAREAQRSRESTNDIGESISESET